MSIDIIFELIFCFAVYICIGMMIAVFMNDMDYFDNDYYLLTMFAYPIIILILLYVELRRFIEEIKNNLRGY